MDFVKIVREFEKAMNALAGITVVTDEKLKELNSDVEGLASNMFDGCSKIDLDFFCQTCTKEPEESTKEEATEKKIKRLKRERKHAHPMRQQQIDREINDLKRRK